MKTKFQPGDRVRIIKEPIFIGGKGSDWMTPVNPDPESWMCRYDMTHLIGVEVIIRGFRPNILGFQRWEDAVEGGYGWWLVDYPPGTKVPVGLSSEGLAAEYLEKVETDAAD